MLSAGQNSNRDTAQAGLWLKAGAPRAILGRPGAFARSAENAGSHGMQTQNRLLDDLARVATGALGVAAGMRDEIEARLRDQFEKVLARMDLVTREEFDAVKAMAAKARGEQDILAARVAALEA